MEGSYQDWDQGLARSSASDAVEEVEGEEDALECFQLAEAAGQIHGSAVHCPLVDLHWSPGAVAATSPRPSFFSVP